MSKLDDLDRLPTKLERFIGAGASLLIALALTGSTAVAGRFLLHHPEQATFPVLAVLAGLCILALWAARVFVGILQGKARKPSPLSRLLVGGTGTVWGAFHLGQMALVGLGTARVPPSIFVASGIFISGLVVTRHAWRQLRSRAP